MCTSKECTLRTQCYRYRAIPSYCQSYCDFYSSRARGCFININEDDEIREVKECESN